MNLLIWGLLGGVVIVVLLVFTLLFTMQRGTAEGDRRGALPAPANTALVWDAKRFA